MECWFIYFQDRPKTSRCLGVFGLSLYTTEREVKDVISRYGPIENINLVHDHQTGRSRGFAFVYMRNLEDAIEVCISFKMVFIVYSTC